MKLLALLAMLIPSLSFSQSHSIKELEHQLNSRISISKRISILLELSDACISINPDQAKKYLDQVLVLNKKDKNLYAYVKSYLDEGYIASQSDNDSGAINFYGLADKYNQQLKDPRFNIYIIEGRGEIYAKGKLLDSGLNLLRKSLLLAESAKDSLLAAYALNGLGASFFNRGQVDSGIYYMKESIHTIPSKDADLIKASYTLNLYMNETGNEILEANMVSDLQDCIKTFNKWDSHYGMVQACQVLANYYVNIDSNYKAIEYYKEELKHAKAIPLNLATSLTFANIGFRYLEVNEFDKAQNAFNQALEISKRPNVNIIRNIAIALSGICKLQVLKKDYRKGLEIGQHAMNYAIAANETAVIRNLYLTIGQSYAGLKEFKKALAYADSVRSLLPKNTYSWTSKTLYLDLSKLYDSMKLPEKALEYYKIYTTIKDSLFRRGQAREMNEFIAKYDAQESKASATAANKEANRKAFIALVSVGIAIVLLIALYFTKSYLAKEKRQKKLIAALKADMNHRVGHNLDNIIDELKQFGTSAGFNDETLQSLTERIKNYKDIHILLEEKTLQGINFREMATTISDWLKKSYRKPHTIITISGDYFLYPKDATPIARIVNELLTNTLKHAFVDRDDIQIKIDLKRDKGFFIFTYHDNGPGFKQQKPNRKRLHGLFIITLMSDELAGDYSMDSNNKCRFSLTFKRA